MTKRTAKLIIITPSQTITCVRSDGHIIATSINALFLAEDGYDPIPYLPLNNVLPSALTPAAKTSKCPHKGQAAYFDIYTKLAKAWTYYAPLSPVAAIAQHVAFFPDSVSFSEKALPPIAPEATDILKFWFNDTPPKTHFVKDDAVDQAIKTRFMGLHKSAIEGRLANWQNHPDSALALIILIDQFSRNLFRNKPDAYAYDHLGLAVAEQMIADGFDLALPPQQRAFVYLPHMHSEVLVTQNKSVALYEERLPGSNNVAFAHSHRDDIHRYGRFPGRDKALGR